MNPRLATHRFSASQEIMLRDLREGPKWFPWRRQWPTRNALERLGLLDVTGKGIATLTALGRAVTNKEFPA